MIELKNICKNYETRIAALKNINLTIQDGEIFGIIGQSGAGKSTLIRCINMLETPTSGQIIINGKDLTTLSATELRKERRQIGMIFQHFNLLSNRTVYENIAFPLELSHTPAKEKEAKITSILELVGLSEYKNKYPSQLSGGQKQRVGIARALVSNPSVLLSDEATSALDPGTVKSILQLLKAINKKLHITIILITHQMEVIKSIADRVAVIEKGQIIEESSVSDLFTSPKTDTSKNFIDSISSNTLPEGLSHYNIHTLKQHETDHTIMRLSFRGDVANEPIITQLSKSYNVEISILYGTVDFIQNVSFGKLIIDISGTEKNISSALHHLHKMPIESEVLGYVSHHN